MVLLVLSYVVLNNILAFITIFVSTFCIFLILSKAPKEVKITVDSHGIIFDNREFFWGELTAWTVVKYVDNQYEFAFQTKIMQEPFISFFVTEDNAKKFDLETLFSQKLRMVDNLIMNNPVEVFIRWIGLK